MRGRATKRCVTRGIVAAILCLGAGVAASVEAQVSPVNLGPRVNSAARDAEPTFTADGNTMYFNCFGRMGGSGNDICVTHRVAGEWAEPEIVDAVSTEGVHRGRAAALTRWHPPLHHEQPTGRSRERRYLGQ